MKVKLGPRLILGLFLFVVWLGYPIVSMFRFTVQHEGWLNALRSLGGPLLFGAGFGFSMWLIFTGIFPTKEDE